MNNAGLAKQLKQLPNTPGVYRFFDSEDKLLYVGKATSLKNRVRSYFQTNAMKMPRNQLMVPCIARLETTVTPTANDALLLEQDQIKSLEPKYNVLFRDDKSYPYLKVSKHKYPRLSLHRGIPDKGCHGPFANGWSVRESIRILQKIFLLRTCTDSNFASRTRPCLLHQIKQCSAPCVEHEDAVNYAQKVDEAKQFLAGNNTIVTKRLTKQMDDASKAQNYELAARLRDSIKALADVQQMSSVTGGATDADYITVVQSEVASVVRLAAVRGARIVSELNFFPKNANNASNEEIIIAFCSHHYTKHFVPSRIFVNTNLSPTAISQAVGSTNVNVITKPQKFDKERLAMVAQNAEVALATHSTTQSSNAQALQELADELSMPPIKRIDCFDVSHTMGNQTSASCVVCIDGQMENKRYKRFNIRSVDSGDDYAALQEAVMRRYKRSIVESLPLPDLVLIDGGIGQVNAVSKVFAQLGLDVMLLGIAKGAERKPGLETLVTGDGELIDIAPVSLSFRLLQKIRDEAHRFALASHRHRRNKKSISSILDQIEGVGPQRRRLLINEFGGLAGLRKASPRDLTRIEGVGSQLARRIYQALHS